MATSAPVLVIECALRWCLQSVQIMFNRCKVRAIVADVHPSRLVLLSLMHKVCKIIYYCTMNLFKKCLDFSRTKYPNETALHQPNWTHNLQLTVQNKTYSSLRATGTSSWVAVASLCSNAATRCSRSWVLYSSIFVPGTNQGALVNR